ncbi:hypothetical protein [Georgenia sp. AZ-5]|uniref:hypothetical protein n=1 Tax=Georgenia sp. AZ-5 TaxID=3367526 RepID=UPI0037548105
MKEAAKEEASQVAQTAGEGAQEVRETAREKAVETAEVAKDTVRQTAEQARYQARDLLEQGRSELSGQASSQQQRLAGGLRSLSGDLGSLASGQGGADSMAADLARQVSEYVDRAGAWLEQREPGEVLQEVSRYARRHPGAFMAISAGLGLLVGRVARSMKDESSQASGTARHAAGYGADYPAYTGTGYATTGAEYAGTGAGYTGTGTGYTGTAAGTGAASGYPADYGIGARSQAGDSPAIEYAPGYGTPTTGANPSATGPATVDEDYRGTGGER